MLLIGVSFAPLFTYKVLKPIRYMKKGWTVLCTFIYLQGSQTNVCPASSIESFAPLFTYKVLKLKFVVL